MRVSFRAVFLFIAGIFLLVAPRWLPDEPLWKRAAIILLGMALLAFAVWWSKQPSEESGKASRIVQGYWVARAGIPGIAFLIAPFALPDEPLWRRAGMFALGAALLALAVRFGSTEKLTSKTEL